MTNYYEELMPIKTDEEDYLKYYFKESTPLFDKLNTIIKKGKPIQRQALLKNLIIYEKDSLFKSLINFIINSIQVWDIETVLCLPKSLYEIITNINYILNDEIFNIIFLHMIKSLSSGFEKARNEYLYYFNKIIEFYSVIDIKNNNEIKQNFFPYKIKEEIIQLIIDMGIFGQTVQNRKLCCYLCSSICRIYFNKKEKNIENDINKLYQRLNYLFWDTDKITEVQMTRELFYIIPLFYQEMFKSDDVIQALQSYINHDGDHVIQVMIIISLLKNIKYLNKKKENCGFIFNVLMNKIKEIIEDFDYESIYKNIILHTLINSIYINYDELDTTLLYPVFQLGIMKNYYNFYQLDILFIKNFDKYFFLIEFFLENAPNLEQKFNENEKSEISTHKMLIEQIRAQINFEAYFVKIINELFSDEEEKENNNDKIDENKKENENEINNKENNKKNEIAKDKIDLIYNVTQLNNNSNKNEKKNFEGENLIFNDYFLEQNLDSIFIIENENKNLGKYLYNKDLIKKTLYLYLPKIIKCFHNIKNNKILCEKLFFLFEIKNIEFIMNIYSSSMEYLIENNTNILNNNKNILKKHPLYQLLLFLLKKNLENSKPKSKLAHKNNNSNYIPFEVNIYNKLFTYILSNIVISLKEKENNKKNKGLILLGKIIKLLIPKIYKYFKNIVYTKVIDTIDINNNLNLSLNNYKDSIKILYYEKIYEEIFDEIISKIIINEENLGHHIIKEYIEIIPILILYTKEKTKYYNFFIKQIFVSESFYTRKYSIIFYQQCFETFSMNFLIDNNYFSDFCMLLKDKVNLISLNTIELIMKYIKKIVSYSKEKFFDVCENLQEVYDINTKALNDKNSEIIFDKDKNIIINKIIDIKTRIDLYFTEEELIEEKNKENKLINNENILFRQINNNNINNNNIYLTKEENTKINLLQKSKLITNNRYSYMLNTNNKNIVNNLNSSQKQKNSKNFEKPLKLIKDRGKHLSMKNANIFKGNFIKEKKSVEVNNTNVNINTFHYNKKYNSVIKNNKNNNNNINKYFLPKMQEHEIKLFEKDYNTNNNNETQNVKSQEFSLNKYNYSEKKTRKNEQRFNIDDTKNRLQSAKMNLTKSFNKEVIQIKSGLNSMKIIDEKKNNNHNMRYSYDNENCNFANNLDEKDLEEKELIRPRSKIMKLNKNSFISNKIYIDANK